MLKKYWYLIDGVKPYFNRLDDFKRNVILQEIIENNGKQFWRYRNAPSEIGRFITLIKQNGINADDYNSVIDGERFGRHYEYIGTVYRRYSEILQRHGYLDFEDIQIPNGLTLERNKSYLYVTESLKTGMLSFKTSRPVGQVLAYFTENMPRDNWESVSVFKFRKNIMLYRKEGKNCLIIIEESAEGPNQLVVEIWVSPQEAAKKRESLLQKVIKK